MSDLIHLKDSFGNDLYFGDTGQDQVHLPAVPNVQFRSLLKTVSDLPLQENDVIVVGYPKSGNNWTHHMVSMLKAGTTELPPMFEHDSFRFLEGFSADCQFPPPSGEPRVFLSHLPFHFLPRDVREKKVKVVYLTRNPKDVMVSLYSHVRQVKMPLGYEGTWPEFFQLMLEQGFWYGDMFKYLLDWQREKEAHPHHPIITCSYEDTKRDTLGQVERLNQFLDTGRDRQLCADIVRTCRLDNMHVTRPLREEITHKVFLWKEKASNRSLYRKGEIGDWKNWFTVAQNALFDDVYSTKMADYKTVFLYE